VEVNIRYEGDLHCEAVHGPSGNRLVTDAPVDNGGRGEAFSPTDLVATALGACPVRQSLSPEVRVVLDYPYPD